MGSTICVRCGANLIPYSYCDVCNDILRFACSSCAMRTDERVHTYCRNVSMINNIHAVNLQDFQPVMDNSNSYQLIIGDKDTNIHLYLQDQLNDKIKDSSIQLSSSYWSSVFESTKLINRYWTKIFEISNKHLK
jgi:hypothetical protein